MTTEALSQFLAAQRSQAGGLTSQLDAFWTALVDRGYAASTTREQVRLVADLGRWLERRRLSVADLDEAHLARFLAYRHRRGWKPRSNVATLRFLLRVMREMGVIPPVTLDAEVDVGPVVRFEHEFSRYLVEDRALSISTRVNYVPVVRSLLSWRFGVGPVKVADLRPDDITGFIVRQARTVSPGRLKVVVPALRSFLRWVYLRGETTANLAECVPRVADWRLATLPKSIPSEQVEHLLRCCDRTTATGRRDLAVLLLLARLGLRAGEVVAMELDDIDWEAGVLLVRGKGGRHDRLPLLRDVGAALASYLRHGRPRCSTRRVFVRAKAPLRGFSSSVAICDIVRKALARAGIDSPRKGAHLLRHALACTMLREGASLPEISEVLRHRSSDTTALYAKVDLVALRALARPWPLAAGGP